MRDLEKACGLPVLVEDDGQTLRFGAGVRTVSPDVRYLADMRPVLYNQTISEPEELYYMYRGVGREDDLAEMAALSLRFDLTVLPPHRLGREFMKTAGHYHPKVAGSDLTYPELYQVLSGRAHFLLQQSGSEEAVINDVVIVEAEAGEYLLVPPGYGHVTINPGREALVMANWVDASFQSVYAPMQEHRGAAYYEVEESGQAIFIENEHYQTVPIPRLAKTGLPQLPGLQGDAIYQLPLEALAFLRDPLPYRDQLAQLLSAHT